MAVTQSLTLTESAVNTTDNSSKVRILWKSTQSGDSWNGNVRTAKYYISINGGTETELATSYTLPKNSTTTIVDATITVSHKLDGSGSVSVRTWMDTGISAGVVAKTASLTLTTIPRATTIDSLKCNTSYVDGTITALYTPKNSAFYTQRIVYVNVNNMLTQIHTKNLGQSVASQQTHTLKFDDNELSTIYSKVTNTATAKIRVTLRTYSNSGYSTKVGSDQSLEISLALPEAIAPKATLTITPVNPNAWLASKNIYAAGLSGATVTLSAEPGKSATLAATNIVYANTTYNAVQLNVATLKTPGNIEFTGKVTDSRGRTATDPQSITVLPYSSPVIASMTAERGTYDNGWTDSETGPDVRVVFKTTLSLTDEGNAYAAAFELDKAAITPSHSVTTELTSGAEYSAYFVGINGDTSHVLKLTTTDSVGNIGVATITVPTTYITVEYRANGKGIAFGKTSEKDGFECAWDADFNGDVNIDGALSIGGAQLDTIVEQGTSAINHTVDGVTARSGTWTYRKWSSGIMECWGIGNVNVKINMTWSGTGLYYGVVSTINFPFAFTDIPVCTVDVAYGNHEKSLVVASCGRGTNVYARPIMLCRNTSETVNCDLHYHAIGRWK